MEIFSPFYAGVHLVEFLNALTCSPTTLFSKCIKLHEVLSLFSTINIAYLLEINIFGRDIFQRYYFPLHIQDLL